MKPIQSELKAWMKKNENFQTSYQNIRKEVLDDPSIKHFLTSHPELTSEIIDKHLIKLYEYKSQSKQCDRCKSLGGCQNMIQGYSPVLEADKNEIRLSYEKCHKKLEEEQNEQQQKLIQSLYMPKEILQARISEVIQDEHRSNALAKVLDFLEASKQELPKKGLYLYGSFGVGKTYLLGAIANELKKLQYSISLIYMPEFVREIKSSFKDDSFNEKIDFFKKADVLMLDDMGAEMQSAWFRDEVLGSVLQYRMMEGLPVFITSNYDLDQLEQELSTTRNGVEQVKAGRIIERIKQVTTDVKLNGPNRRG
ncbi:MULTISPECIES: primosomal protein DnaI [Oceanobacillus]|uniref:Primosomal protein DnaI n=1 Tax=Oceanobacillus kimchii TaxID=746691 RepID=A0ABQ5TIX5_9BACI|nr:primosomal protein DnaI [Oceanobacillus kimchii]MBT2600847.1 primosomal protein DnaI [Oceanobacillus sp. ISL-74]MBT2650756.1 primosomal protein DnaI [Oceanobacillus sp. ISL-73]GLO66818.1 primosomal protein DnaI [Oceanobacillus kimchii]